MTNDAQKFTDIVSGLKKRLDVISVNISKLVSKIQKENVRNYASIKDQLAIEYEKARVVINEWARAEIPAIYRDSIRQEILNMKALPINVPNVNFTDLISGGDAESLKSILNNVLTSFETGLASGEQQLNRLVNLTQQTAITEKAVNDALAKGYEQGGSAHSAKKQLQQELLAKAIDEKYIEIIDKNGDSRMYNLSDYAELVARTKLADASAQAVLNTADQVNADLVQISSHNTLTPLCAEYEGKIFSLSGNDPDFPLLDQAPPFHPNCMHSMSITFKEALQLEGTLDKYSEFSNDEISKPPVGKGFIPVSERNMN